MKKNYILQFIFLTFLLLLGCSKKEENLNLSVNKLTKNVKSPTLLTQNIDTPTLKTEKKTTKSSDNININDEEIISFIKNKFEKDKFNKLFFSSNNLELNYTGFYIIYRLKKTKLFSKKQIIKAKKFLIKNKNFSLYTKLLFARLTNKFDLFLNLKKEDFNNLPKYQKFVISRILENLSLNFVKDYLTDTPIPTREISFPKISKTITFPNCFIPSSNLSNEIILILPLPNKLLRFNFPTQSTSKKNYPFINFLLKNVKLTSYISTKENTLLIFPLIVNCKNPKIKFSSKNYAVSITFASTSIFLNKTLSFFPAKEAFPIDNTFISNIVNNLRWYISQDNKTAYSSFSFKEYPFTIKITSEQVDKILNKIKVIQDF